VRSLQCRTLSLITVDHFPVSSAGNYTATLWRNLQISYIARKN
jgi:hypothetical protein